MWRTIQKKFRQDRSGGVATIFAVSAVPLMMFVSFGITYGERNAQATKAQQAVDAAALAGVSAFQISNSTPASQASLAQSAAQSFLAAQVYAVQDIASNSTISVDSAAQTVTVTYASPGVTAFSSLVGFNLPINLTSKANFASVNGLNPVCILITNPSDGHTLLSGGTAKVDIYNCMVQVNTDDWDAVQADNTSYIHIHQKNSGDQNCYVGNIHFGDITPPKQPTCKMLVDPYSSIPMPTGGTATCTDNANYTNVTSGTTFNQASYGGQIQIKSGSVTFDPSANGGVMTFCKNLQIMGGNVTFLPGTYYFNGAQFNVQGTGAAAAQITANQVAFVFTGTRPSLKMQGGTLAMTPATSGTFKGFQMYWGMSGNKAASMSFKDVTLTTAGVLYLAGAEMDLTDTNFTHVGSLVADKFLPSGASTVSLTGDTPQQYPLPSSGGLFKATQAMIPQLVQ